MKQQEDKKNEQIKKIIEAIGNLPDDMISKANPENWENGMYIGIQSEKKDDMPEFKQNKIIVLGEWLVEHRKLVSLAAMLFVCVIVTGVWKMNSLDTKIENKLENEKNPIVQQTDEPESTYYAWDGKGNKKSKTKKSKNQKGNNTINKDSNQNSKKKDKPSDNYNPSDEDDEPLPTMEIYSDENDDDSNRKGESANDTKYDDNSQSEKKDAEVSASPTTDKDNESTEKNDQETSISAYKIDSQGNRTALDIQSSDKKKLALIIEGKKFSSETNGNDYSAVVKYKEKEYFYDAKSKMLIASGKCAVLSESENIELKRILKLD